MISVLLATTLQASAPAGGSIAAPTTPGPQWVRRPTGEHLRQYYPAKARRDYVEGRATILCRVTDEGAMADCGVLSEDPVDYGFGEAALAMSRFFTLHASPGQPVGGPIKLPIRFTLPPRQTAETAASAAVPAWIVPDWLSRATAQDLARVYPERAARRGIEGIVMVVCRATAEGTLRACVVEQEAPPGFGLGDAAIKLTTKFKMRPQTREGRPVDGGVVRLPLQFRLPK